MTSVTSGAITRYRVLAYTTGVLLIVLILVAMPLKYWGGHPGLDTVVGMAHGMVFYPLYVIASLDLALRARWSPVRTLLIMVAGTVPFAAIYLERNVARQAQAQIDAAKAKAAAKAEAKAAKAKTPEPASAE
jgi:integral membrane protein